MARRSYTASFGRNVSCARGARLVLLVGGLFAAACGEAGDLEPTTGASETSAALATPGLHGFRIMAGGDATLSVNAYGGAADGGPLKLYPYCPWSNADCTWTYKNGRLLSDANPQIGISTSAKPVDGEALVQSAHCGGSSPPSSCLWVYQDGRFYSVASGQNMAIYAKGGAVLGSDLVLRRSCTSSASANCHWVIQGAMISTAANVDSLMYNAWGGARDGADVKLTTWCSRDNPDCTWTFKNGMILSDTNPALALNAYGGAGVGTPIKLSAYCDVSNPDCRWRLESGVLYSDASNLAIKPDGPNDQASLSLVNGCNSSSCRVALDIGGGSEYWLTDAGRIHQPSGLYDDLDVNTLLEAIRNSGWKAKGGVNMARWRIVLQAVEDYGFGFCGTEARKRYSAAPGSEWCSEFAKSMFYFASNAFNAQPAIHDIRACTTFVLGICASYDYLFRDANTVLDMLTIFGANGGRVDYGAIGVNTPQPGDYLAMDGGTGPETHSGIILAVSDDLRYIWTIEGNVNDCVAFQRHDWVVNGILNPQMNMIGKINVAY